MVRLQFTPKDDKPRTITPRPKERFSSWVARLAPATKVLSLVLLGVLITLIVWAGYSMTVSGTFLREVVMAGLGAVLTVLSAAALALVAWFAEAKRLREQREIAKIEDDAWRQQSIRVGRMEIPDIAVVAASNAGIQWTSRATVEFASFAPARTILPEVRSLMDSLLPAFRAKASEAGITLTNDACVDIVDARVELRRLPDGRRSRHYTLTPAKADYFDFIASTANMDTAIEGKDPLRKLADKRPTGLSDLKHLPAMAKLGCGTAVVTRDDRLVLGVRGRAAVAGKLDAQDKRSLVHIVAEGATPADIGTSGVIDPREVVRRALAEELAIGGRSHDHARVVELIDTGFFFDQLRWQPCFAFLARIDQDWPEVQTAAATAVDLWEVEELRHMPFDIRNPEMRQLLLGTHPDLVLASNHAASVLWFALLYQHGITECRDYLTRE